MLVLLLALAQQTFEPFPPTPFDRVIPVEIDAKDSPLEERGRGEWLDVRTEFRGTLHLWPKGAGDLDLCLRVETPEGKLLGEDDNSGGGKTPYLKLEVEPGRDFVVIVAVAQGDATGAFELCAVAAPETDETRAASEEAKLAIAELKRLSEANDLDAGRKRALEFPGVFLAAPGSNSSELVAARMWELGYATYGLSILRPTESAWRHAFQHRLRTLPDEHPDLQWVRSNLALMIKASGDLASARALQEMVLAIRTRTLREEDLPVQWARTNLGATLHELGDYSGARALFEQVLAVYSRSLPEEHSDLLAVHENLASSLYSLGDLQGARALQEQVLAVYTRTLLDEHPNLQRARANLALTIEELGDLHGARVLQEQVLAVFTRTLPDEHPHLQVARGNLALTIKQLGDLHGARALLERVLAIYARTLPAEHPHVLVARLNLAGTISALGDLYGARALQEQVFEVYSRTLPDEHADLQLARGNLAWTLYSLGDLRGARALQEQVLAVYSNTLPEEHPTLQLARLNLATTIKAMGDLDGARALQEQVLAIYVRTLPDEHPHLQWARNNRGATLYDLGDLAGARALFEQVLTICTRMLPDEHPELQTARLNMAATLGAETTRDALSRGGETNKEMAEAREMCTRLLHAAAAGHQSAFAFALASASPREVEEAGAASLNTLDETLSFAAGYGALGALRELDFAAFSLSETTRGAAVRSAARQRRTQDSRATDSLRARVRSATDELARLAQSGAERDAFQAARAEREAAQRELAALARELSGGLDLERPVTAEAVAHALGRDDAVVAYRRFARHDVKFESAAAEGVPPREESTESLCAFVVRPGIAGASSTLTVVPLGALKPIEVAVQAWRDAIGLQRERGLQRQDGALSAPESAGAAVRKLVWDPIVAQIGEARRVVVATDDVLQLVALDALPLDEGRLVGERWRIEPRVTLGELLDPTPARVEGGVVALGGASFQSEPVDLSAKDLAVLDEDVPSTQVASLLRGGAWERGFKPLTYTGLEAREIAALHEEVFEDEGLVLEKRKASRAALESAAPRARWLHVATHGWHAPESVKSFEDVARDASGGVNALRASSQDVVKGMSPMLLCGLALAGANLPEDAVGRAPGLFTAEEMSALDLSNCELAVLSACDTNVGIRKAGQGVASFQRALQMAGARSVITSLWKVPDEATRELMLDFYRRIWVLKQPKWQALWEAKMALRNAKDESDEPRYSTRDWAAWVLSGEPD